MRIVFWIVGILWIVGGVLTDLQAKSAIHQILAQIDYLIAAILIVGAEIIAAINASVPREDASLASAQEPAVMRSMRSGTGDKPQG